MTPTRQMWNFFKPVRMAIWGASLLSAFTYVASIALLATSGWLISHAALRPPILTLEIAIVGVRTFALSRGVTRYAERLVSHNATFAALTDLRVAVYESLDSETSTHATNLRDGDLLSRIVDDVDDIQNLPLRIVIPLAACGLSTLFAFGLTLWLLPLAGLLLLTTVLLAIVGGAVSTWYATRQSETQTANLRGELTAQMVEFLAGSTDIALMNATEACLADIAKVNEHLTEVQKRQAWGQGLGVAIITGSQGLALLSTLMCGISAVNNHSLPGASLAALVFVPLVAFEAIATIPQAMSALAQVRGSAARLAELLDLTTADQDFEASVVGNDISLLHINARWPGASLDAISDITLHIPTGSRHALVGRSGSGKSTLAHVLGKFLVPTTGTYFLGGQEARSLSETAVRSHVVVSWQDAHIFATSVRENLHVGLTPGAELPSDDRLWATLEKVDLAMHVASLPNGLDTIIGERGATLSGGERHRLALARMFVAQPDVWVLDEPTEHLDATTAQKVLSNVYENLGTGSVFLITHRLLETVSVDRVTLIENGAVLESGTPEELGGTYKMLLDRERQASEKTENH